MKKIIVIIPTVLLLWLGCGGVSSYSQSPSYVEAQRNASISHFADSVLQKAENLDANGISYTLKDYIHDNKSIVAFAKKLGTQTPHEIIYQLRQIVDIQKSFGPSASKKKYGNFFKGISPVLGKTITLVFAFILAFLVVFVPGLIRASIIIMYRSFTCFIESVKNFYIKQQAECLILLPTIKNGWHYGSRRWGDVYLSIDHIP